MQYNANTLACRKTYKYTAPQLAYIYIPMHIHTYTHEYIRCIYASPATNLLRCPRTVLSAFSLQTLSLLQHHQRTIHIQFPHIYPPNRPASQPSPDFRSAFRGVLVGSQGGDNNPSDKALGGAREGRREGRKGVDNKKGTQR